MSASASPDNLSYLFSLKNLDWRRKEAVKHTAFALHNHLQERNDVFVVQEFQVLDLSCSGRQHLTKRNREVCELC